MGRDDIIGTLEGQDLSLPIEIDLERNHGGIIDVHFICPEVKAEEQFNRKRGGTRGEVEQHRSKSLQL